MSGTEWTSTSGTGNTLLLYQPGYPQKKRKNRLPEHSRPLRKQIFNKIYRLSFLGKKVPSSPDDLHHRPSSPFTSLPQSLPNHRPPAAFLSNYSPRVTGVQTNHHGVAPVSLRHAVDEPLTIFSPFISLRWNPSPSSRPWRRGQRAGVPLSAPESRTGVRREGQLGDRLLRAGCGCAGERGVQRWLV